MNCEHSFFNNIVQNTVSSGFVAENDRVLLALSGGPDSVFLLYVLTKIREKLSFYLSAIHVNHHLRACQSDSDQNFVERLTGELDVSLNVYHVDVKSTARQRKLSVEMAARELRYECYEQQAQKDMCDKICVAHTADDRIETSLMRLINGSSLLGITGLRRIRSLSDKYSIVRPLLGCWKKDILEWLDTENKSYCIDSSNKSPVYMRNRVRNELIPMIEQSYNSAFKTVLNSTLDIMEGQADVFLNAVSDCRSKALIRCDFLHVYDKKACVHMNKTLICAMLMQSIYTLADDSVRLVSAQFENLLSNLDSTEQKTFQFPCGCAAIVDRSYIIMARKDRLKPFFEFHNLREKIHAPLTISTVAGDGLPVELRFSCKQIQQPLFLDEQAGHDLLFDDLIRGKEVTIRTLLDKQTLDKDCFLTFRMPGQRILLRRGSKKLKKYFIDEGIPPLLRNILPVVAVENMVIWVPCFSSLKIDTNESLFMLEISLKM